MLRIASRLQRHAWGLALGGWFVGLSLLAAGLLARHLVAMPAVSGTPTGALASLRAPGDTRWLAVHALYAECSCSRLITDHLLRSDRPAGWSEVVLWAGDAAPDPGLTRRGFQVLRVSREALAGYGIASVPSLLALDPENRVRYAGGYTQRAPGVDPEDLRILSQARTATIAALPVFGCAVSERLRRALSLLPSP